MPSDLACEAKKKKKRKRSGGMGLVESACLAVGVPKSNLNIAIKKLIINALLTDIVVG
jgi:hypothetical protein